MLPDKDGVTWTPCIRINGVDLSFVEYIRQDVYNLNLEKPLEESYESIAGIVNYRSNNEEYNSN